MATILHLRSETKPLEHRSCLTPTTAKALIDAGYTVNVERSPVRIFDDEEFEKIGATLVPEFSWKDAPKEHLIVGLKELPEEDFPLIHEHITFAHCYKNQGGWQKVLGRFPRGGGTLYDLEFLQDTTGRRVAAFGYHAGFTGAALAIQAWNWQLNHPDRKKMPGVESYKNEDLLIADVKKSLEEGKAKSGGKEPRILVMGALGRCGGGAVDLSRRVGISEENIIKWDMAETAKGGPFQEIVDSDIFVNCIYLSAKIPPFLTPESLQSPSRALKVVCDVSCDTTNPNNPIPIYSINTTFDDPVAPADIKIESGPPLDVISIDHLPSLLPREASEQFSKDLLPSLLLLNKRNEAPVWVQAKELFNEKVGLLDQ